MGRVFAARSSARFSAARLLLLRAGVELIEKVPYTPAHDGAPSVPGEYELVGALRPEHLAAFTAALAEHYLMPISLTMEPKTLEDVFLDISGRDIR